MKIIVNGTGFFFRVHKIVGTPTIQVVLEGFSNKTEWYQVECARKEQARRAAETHPPSNHGIAGRSSNSALLHQRSMLAPLARLLGESASANPRVSKTPQVLLELSACRQFSFGLLGCPSSTTFHSSSPSRFRHVLQGREARSCHPCQARLGYSAHAHPLHSRPRPGRNTGTL
jgi:hypothetical protein